MLIILCRTRKAILFFKPQLYVGIVASKLKLVLRPRVYKHSVCNFPRGVLLHVILLNIVSLQSSTTLPPFRNIITKVLQASMWLRIVWGIFCGATYPEWKLLYRLWHSLLLEKWWGMCGERHDPKFQTQPLSFSSCRWLLIPPLPRSHIPMAGSVVRELTILCVCVLGGGCLESFHSWLPADPWGHGGHSLCWL